MGIINRIGTLFSSPKTEDRSRYVDAFRNRLNSRYDSSRTTDDNERHWANADYLSPNASLSTGVRRKIRARARYEAQENNSYAKGMILTLANDLIGTGPRLQIQTGNKRANRIIEARFQKWAMAINLPAKLRTMRLAKCVDGESFALMTTRDAGENEISLDVRPIEADRVEGSFHGLVASDEDNDGIRYDKNEYPTEYHVLRDHPGSMSGGIDGKGDWVKRKNILHIFRQDRPEQHRGVSEITTALPLFSQLRRFTLAVLAAGETAASMAGVLYTDSPGIGTSQLGEDQWFDAIPIEHRALLTLPNGWKMGQMRAEHPSTTYDMFKREIINEIARCLNMPYNVAAANSSGYNYSSGRLDHQVYYKSIDVERSEWECCVMNRIFQAWLEEAAITPGAIPVGLPPYDDWSHLWYWDHQEHVDPNKTATAKDKNIKSGITNRKAELARDGFDIDTNDEAAAESYGITVQEYRQRLFAFHFPLLGVQTEEEQEDEDEQEVNENQEESAQVDSTESD